MTERATNLTDAIARQVAATLDAMAKEQREFEASVQEFESQGRRIIDGGQIDRNRWEYTDWRTGEVLAKGRCKDHDKLQMPDNWCHADNLHDVTEPERVEGLPESLAESIIYWTFDHEEEARAFAADALTAIERDQARSNSSRQ